MEEINYDIMRYDLDNDGYVCNVYFGCSSGTCVGYTGEIPEDYETLEQWAENANIRAYKIVDGNLVFDANRDYKLKVLYEQESNDNAHITKKEMGMASVEEINPYTDLFPSHESAGGYITSLDGTFNKVGNLPTEEVNLSLFEEQDLDLIELEFIGNNFLPNTAISSVNNGIEFTQNKDKTINISGSATDRSTLNLAGTDTSVRNILTFKGSEKYINSEGVSYKSPTNYLLFGLVDGVSLEFYHYDGSDRTLVGIYNGGIISFEEDTNVTQVVLVVDKGITIDTMIKPMLQLISLDYPTLPLTKYCGNLLDYTTGVSFSVSDTTVKIIENGLNVQGNWGVKFPLSLPAGSYYFDFKNEILDVGSDNFTDGAKFRLHYSDNTYSTYIKAGSIFSSNKDILEVLIYISNGTAFGNYNITDIIISKEPKKYEAYNGRDGWYYVDGLSLQKTSDGKNKLDYTKGYAITGGSVKIGNDKLVLTTSASCYGVLFPEITLKPNTTYTIYSDYSFTGNLTQYGYRASINGNWQSVVNSNIRTITTDDTGKVQIAFYVGFPYTNEGDVLELSNIRLYEGSYSIETIPDYEAFGVRPSPDYPSEIINTYKAGIYNVVVNNKVYYFTLPEDLRSLPNGVADRLWFDVNGNNGIDIEKKVGNDVFDGSETTWVQATINGNIYFYINLPNSIDATSVSTQLLSNYFKPTDNNNSQNDFYHYRHNIIVFNHGIATTLEEFKTWLSTHNTEVQYELATYTTSYINQYSGNEYVYEEYKNNTTLIDLAGNEFTTSDKITIKDNQIVLIKNGSIDKIIENGVEKEPEREEIYLGGTVMPRTYTPYTHAYCHQKVFISNFIYRDPRNIDITKLILDGLISITNIESQYNFTSDDLDKVRKHIMEEEILTDEEIEYYDVNGDGVVKATDYVLIKNMIHTYTIDDAEKIISYANGETTLTDEELIKYDVNGDGVIDKLDATEILRMVYNYISTTIKGTFEINTTKSQRVLILRDESGKIKTSIGLNGATTPSLSTEQLILDGMKQPKIMSDTVLPEEVTEGAVFLLYDE